MRLVEVVVLMGAHCVSPVEHTQMMTEAAKVQCAVVIEKDTEKGTLSVTPQSAAADPQVAAAVTRFRVAGNDPLSANGMRIVPAFAPAGEPPVQVKPAAPRPADADADAAAAPAVAAETAPAAAAEAGSAKTAPDEPPAAEPAPAETKLATLAPPPQKASAAKAQPQKAAPARKQPAKAQTSPDTPKAVGAKPAVKQSSQCKGAAVAKWYTAADGHRKYRCVRPVPASDSAPDQLY